VLSLERAAHTTLCLVQDLQSSTAQLSATTLSDSTTLPSLRTPLEPDTERAQFLMKLAPRIRRLESDTIKALSTRLESVLKQLQEERRENNSDQTKVRPRRNGVAFVYVAKTLVLTLYQYDRN
jgi:hypothetical protein